MFLSHPSLQNRPTPRPATSTTNHQDNRPLYKQKKSSVVHHVALRATERLADLSADVATEVAAPAPHSRVPRGGSNLSVVVTRAGSEYRVDEVPLHVRVILLSRKKDKQNNKTKQQNNNNKKYEHA